jgi:hypothetical protein
MRPQARLSAVARTEQVLISTRSISGSSEALRASLAEPSDDGSAGSQPRSRKMDSKAADSALFIWQPYVSRRYFIDECPAQRYARLRSPFTNLKMFQAP